MPNPHRGDVAAILDGQPHTLRLTLGALAELEAALDVPDLIALAERFESGTLTAPEAIAILAAGLRGAGHSVSDAEVAAMTIDGGIAGAVKTAAALLTASFQTAS